MLAGCPFPVRGGGSGVPRPRVFAFLAVRVLFALCFLPCCFSLSAGRGVFFSCFSCKFFACVYVFVFQGCAVREAGVLCVGGIKKFEKSHGKVWLFGLSVVLLHSLSGTKRRRKAEPGGGSSMIGLHKR